MQKKLLPLADKKVGRAAAAHKSVRLDGEFVDITEAYAAAAKRSVPKQIEHWAQIGRIAEDNPDLPYSFIRDALIAEAEVEKGLVTPYARKSKAS